MDSRNAIVYVSFEPYFRLSQSFTAADYSGASTAHHDLLEEALESGCVSEAHLIIDADSAEVVRKATHSLNMRLGRNAVSVESPLNAAQIINKPNAILVTRFRTVAKAIYARSASPGCTIPICVLLHAAMFAEAPTSYLMALLALGPQDAIVVSSEAGRSALEEGFKQSSALLEAWSSARPVELKCRIVSISLGLRQHWFREMDRSVARGVLDLDLETLIVLYFGRMNHAGKADLDVLLRAFSVIKDPRSSAKLVIAGQDVAGKGRQAISVTATALGLENDLIVVANPPGFARQLLLAAADVFVSPADNIFETFGISLLEAMAMRLPIVASDWSGYREIVCDGSSGTLVPTFWNTKVAKAAGLIHVCSAAPSGEEWLAAHTVVSFDHLCKALEDLLANPEKRKAFGEAGRDRCEAKFRWADRIRDYAMLWGEMSAVEKSMPRGSTETIPDLNKMFQHYATDHIDFEAELQLDSQSADLFAKAPAMGGNSNPSGSAMKALIHELASHKPSFFKQQLSNTSSDVLEDAIGWLMKKGVIKSVGP